MLMCSRYALCRHGLRHEETDLQPNIVTNCKSRYRVATAWPRWPARRDLGGEQPRRLGGFSVDCRRRLIRL